MGLRRTLLILLLLTLLLSLIVPSTFAHGGLDDGDGDSASNTSTNSTDSTTSADTTSTDSSNKHGVKAQGNISLGFGMATLSAVCSAIGAAIPFLDDVFPHIPGLRTFRITESRLFLAGSLAISSGVLLFLALTDLLSEAIENFQDADLFDKKYARLVAAAIFIGTSVAIMVAKSMILKFRSNNRDPPCLCDPSASECLCNVFEAGRAPIPGHINSECACATRREVTAKEDGSGNGNDISPPSTTTMLKPHDKEQLSALAYHIAIALGAHNFPEGLTLFATAIESTSLGTVYGIALALHKFPEGICISIPLYYASGKRWKAFIIPALVGIVSQMAGACLGYALFVTVWNPMVSGVLFTIVVATLLYTILHGMLPMARKFDPNDRITTYYLFIGMAFFAVVIGIFDVA